MKTIEYYWDHPDLARYRKEIAAGEFLFRRSEEGNTMFIIIRGIVELLSERDGKDLLVGFVEAGEFLGEKAVLSSRRHMRVFGARARTPLMYLELGLEDMSDVESRSPALFKEMLKQMFLLAAKRLVHANYLSRAIRPSNNIVRLINLILHFGVTTGEETPEGMVVPLTVDRIRYYIDMSEFEVEECLKELEKRDILVRQTDDFYLLKNKDALLKSAPLLKEALPSLTVI